MKFGKALKEELPCEWRGHAVNYKLLKRLLKRCVGLAVHQKLDANTFVHRPSTPLRPPSMSTRDALSSSRAEMTFFWAMRGQLFKVNRLFVFQQYELVRRMGDFDDGLERFLWSSPLPSQAFVRYAIESVLLPRLEKLYLQMKVLEKFCDLNFQAVAKILKKHDKWTGFTTRADYEAFMVDHEPFAAHLPLSMAIGYLEETSFWLTRIIASTPPSSSSFTWPHPSSKAEASRADEDERVESLTSRHGWNSPTNASTTVLKNFEEEEEGDEVAYRLPPLHFVLSPRRLQLLAVAASGLKRQCSRDSDGPPPKRRRG